MFIHQIRHLCHEVVDDCIDIMRKNNLATYSSNKAVVVQQLHTGLKHDYPGPTVIKLFESENELKCKNRYHDLIETLCLFSNY